MVYNHNLLNKYYKLLYRHAEPIICILCNQSMDAKNHEHHCFDQHNLHPKTQCVWCQGRFHWPPKHKSLRENVDHLIECFERFIKKMIPHDIPVEKRPIPATYTFFNMNHLYSEKDFMGHLKISSGKTYRFMKPTPVKSYPLTVDDSNLNSAIDWVHHYKETHKQNQFFHVMIRKVAIPSFKNAMKNHPQIGILPFACWCDGGRYEYQPQYRRHAHMIVCAPKNYFMVHVWPKIGTSDRPCKNYKCMYCEKIESNLHLVNVMGYVCKPESRCNFGRKGKKKLPNHFYFNKTLPVDFQLVLVLQWDGGLLEYIDEKFKNIEPSKLALLPIVDVKGQWKIKIGDLDLFQNRMIPVSKHFIPTSKPTEYYWHLAQDKKMYFEKLETPLPDSEWMEHQRMAGNLLFHVVANEWWTPQSHIQKALNSIHNVVRFKNSKIHELQQKLQSKNIENDALNQKLQLKDIENVKLTQTIQLKDIKNIKLEKNLELKEIEIADLKIKLHSLKRKREMDDDPV